MLTHLLLLTAITAASWAALIPMIRAPRFELAAPEVASIDVPVITFDPRGFA